MNEEQAYSSAIEVVAKYRKLLTWWKLVRVTPRLMHSNIDVIYELLEVINIPVDRIRKEMRKMKKIAKLSIHRCIDIQKILRSILSFIDMYIADVASYSPEETDYVAFAHQRIKSMESLAYKLLESYQQQFTKFCHLWSTTGAKLCEGVHQGKDSYTAITLSRTQCEKKDSPAWHLWHSHHLSQEHGGTFWLIYYLAHSCYEN
ncbi:hypothetical protein CEXT_695311 [Caerostris extrusa]|uniref:Uncharacterized protein n=1 Tax=Caerostris extrusa TaxID=172846 RepID=A0AAV4RRK4_CAEEX|nr:hypothetical protein CEXT_695311 [Caerostris extrusa]